MKIKAIKYLTPVILYLLAYLSFTKSGWLTWSPMIFAWILIPLLELFIPPDESNMNAAEEEMSKKDKLYDYLLYMFVLVQWITVFFFLMAMKTQEMTRLELAGRICTMGLLCGTFGINIGHELGHRIKPAEQWLAKLSLLSSLYMHFFIEHNKGHHKNVATPEDPSSARYNEIIYTFYFRTIILSYLSAWKIANAELLKKGLPRIHFSNEMIRAQFIQLLFICLLLMTVGVQITIYYLIAAGIGILLLETVNYIEHYGLQRKKTSEFGYERALPEHSWNSNHVLGRIMLFELSRHSDHHYLASRKYQILHHHPHAPQLPTGYPGCMIVSLIPPLWFAIMNPKLNRIKKAMPNTLL